MIPRARLPLAVIYILAACSASPRDVKLAGLDLGQPALLAELKEDLAPEEGAALTLYATFHWPGSKSYCGRPAFAQAVEPETIGDAIDRTIAFEAGLTRKRLAESQPASPESLHAQRDQQLIDRFEELALRRSVLLSRVHSQAARTGELSSIDRELESLRHERARLGKQEL